MIKQVNIIEAFCWLCIILTYLPKTFFFKFFKIEESTPDKVFYKKLYYSIPAKIGLYYFGGIWLFYLNKKSIPFLWMGIVSTITFYTLIKKNYIPKRILSTSASQHWKYGFLFDMSILIYFILQFIYSQKPIWFIGTIIWVVYSFTGGIQTSLMESFERHFDKIAWTYSYAFVCTLIFLTAFFFVPFTLFFKISLTADKLIKFYASGIPLFVTIMSIHTNSLLRVIDRHGKQFGEESINPLKAFILYDSLTILIMLVGFLTISNYDQYIDIIFLLTPNKIENHLPFFIFSLVLCFVVGAIGTIYTSTAVYLRYIFKNPQNQIKPS